MPARTLAVTYLAACEQNFSCATRTVFWGRFSADNVSQKEPNNNGSANFCNRYKSEAEDFKSRSANELSSSDNEYSDPDDEKSDLGQECRRRQRIPWELVNKWDPA